MCGLCGIMGPGITSWDMSIIRNMLMVSMLRGVDSTGVLQGKSEEWAGHKRIEYVIDKSANDASYFMWYNSSCPEGNKRLLNNIQDNFICAHTRAATKGSITNENAHPFEFEKIIGMHNGTLTSKKYHDIKKTDSELLIKDINDNGIVPVLKELEATDAYALVLFNKEDGTLSFARNGHRSLFFGFNANRATMYWASEAWMIREMAARNTEKLLKNEVYFFKPNLVHTVHPDDLKTGQNFPFKTEELPEKKLVATGRFQGNGRFQQQRNLFEGDRKPPGIRYSPRKPVVVSGKDKPVFNFKSRIPVVWCCACHKRLSLVDMHYANRLGSNAYVCEDCNTDIDNVFSPSKEVNFH